MSDLISRQAAIDAFGLSEKTRKYGGDHSGYGTMMLYEIQDTLESLSPAQQWIPCSERMPQTNVSILYCTTTGTVGEGRYEGHNGIHEVWKMYAICGTHWDDEVVAWMPLPEPYKGEEA